jgi:D-alanyl-D-alanine dipeptidase
MRRSALVPSQAVERARKYDLVDVRKRSRMAVDLRYGSRKNVAGRALYPATCPACCAEVTAEKLRKAQAILAAQGYGIRMWDAYRPPEVHLLLLHHGGGTGMFQQISGGWSRHCAGMSVDATMVDRRGRGGAHADLL